MRTKDWTSRLNAFIERKRNAPFVWGENDCCLFACDWLKEMTGEDPATALELRGSYHTALGAMRILKHYVGGTSGIATQWCGQKYGSHPCSALLAQRGDIMALSTEHGIALGVCVGYYSAFPGPKGINFVLTGDCRNAWRIG